MLVSCCTDTSEAGRERRPLSLLERYFHIPVITRDAYTVTYLYRYTSSDLPSSSFLSERVKQVQERVHHLWSEIRNGDTNRPHVQLRERPWSAKQIVREDSYGRSLRESEVDFEARLIEREIGRMRARVWNEEAVPWQVTRYLPSWVGEPVYASQKGDRRTAMIPISDDEDSESDSHCSASSSNTPNPSQAPSDRFHRHRHTDSWESDITCPDSDAGGAEQDLPSYIAISAYHHLLDGMAGLSLSKALLSPAGSFYDVASAPDLAPRMEDIVPIGPPLWFAAQDAINELIVPHVLPYLPKSLSSKIDMPHCWPGKKINGKPTDFPEAQISMHIPSDWVSRLKTVSKVNGVNTLHPTLQTAFTLAMYDEMDRPKEPFVVSTPHNERDRNDPSHSHCAGVVLSTFRKVYNLSQSETIHDRGPATESEPDSVLWMLSRELGAELNSPSAKDKARWAIGMLDWLPDSSSFVSPHNENPQRRTKTQWEDFFWNAMERDSPFRSVGFSNLGRTELPDGCTGMRWSQSSIPFDEAVTVSAVGHERGLELCVSFREGCAVTKQDMGRVMTKFRSILGGLIGEKGECEAEDTDEDD